MFLKNYLYSIYSHFKDLLFKIFEKGLEKSPLCVSLQLVFDYVHIFKSKPIWFSWNNDKQKLRKLSRNVPKDILIN